MGGQGRCPRGPDETRSPGFGSFEVDLRAQELRRRGRKLKLGGQPFQALALMLEKPGEEVTRGEFRQRFWSSDTFVDFDNGINIAIKSLRQALGDSTEDPKSIETLPRVGYRFLPHVERGGAETSPQAVEDNRPSLRPVVSISQGLAGPRRRNAIDAGGASAVAPAPEMPGRPSTGPLPARPGHPQVVPEQRWWQWPAGLTTILLIGLAAWLAWQRATSA